MVEGRRPVKLFVSYSHKDTAWFEEINTDLASLQLGGAIEAWSDQDIMPGAMP